MGTIYKCGAEEQNSHLKMTDEVGILSNESYEIQIKNIVFIICISVTDCQVWGILGSAESSWTR